MLVYRLCREPHRELDGEGARLYGGRWNNPGLPAVYTSMHLSLAVLEYLVHVDFDNLPPDLVWLKIEVPDASSREIFSGSIAPSKTAAAAYGDDWLASGTSLSLIVPSAVLSVEKNIILNPLHAEMAGVQILDCSPFEFDDRLFKH